MLQNDRPVWCEIANEHACRFLDKIFAANANSQMIRRSHKALTPTQVTGSISESGLQEVAVTGRLEFGQRTLSLER